MTLHTPETMRKRTAILLNHLAVDPQFVANATCQIGLDHPDLQESYAGQLSANPAVAKFLKKTAERLSRPRMRQSEPEYKRLRATRTARLCRVDYMDGKCSPGKFVERHRIKDLTVLIFLRDNPGATALQIAKHTSQHRSQIYGVMGRLKSAGEVAENAARVTHTHALTPKGVQSIDDIRAMIKLGLASKFGYLILPHVVVEELL